MQRSLSTVLSTFGFTAATALGALLAPLPANADGLLQYEPGFIRQAERALKRGAPERALVLIEANLNEDLKPRHQTHALNLACTAHLQLESPVEAREACIAAQEAQPGKAGWRSLNNLGVAEMRLGNYHAAETALTRAATVSRWERAPRRNLSVLHAVRKSHELAQSKQVLAQSH